MATPIPSALVTAIPTTAGFPTLSGYTASDGTASLPLSDHTAYTLQFSGGSPGTMGAISNFFPPHNASYTLYKLKNVSPSTVPTSVYPVFKYGNTEAGLGRGNSTYAVVGSYPVSIPAGKGPNFKSYKPGSLFGNPTARSTTFRMPAADTNISVVSTPPAKASKLVAAQGAITAILTSTYSTGTNTWSSRALPTNPRSDLSGQAVGSSLYTVDGKGPGALPGTATTSAFDNVTNTWGGRASDLHSRRAETANRIGKQIYAVAGLAFPGGVSTIIAYNHVYSTVANSWKAKASAPKARSNPFAGAIDSVMYVVGGFDKTLTSVNQAYQVTTDTWSSKAHDLAARANAGADVIASVLYAVGGRSTGAPQITLTTSYKPTTNTWTTKTALPVKTSALGARAQAGNLYAVGGGNTSIGLTGANYAYDPATNTWSQKASEIHSRSFYVLGALQ